MGSSPRVHVCRGSIRLTAAGRRTRLLHYGGRRRHRRPRATARRPEQGAVAEPWEPPAQGSIGRSAPLRGGCLRRVALKKPRDYRDDQRRETWRGFRGCQSRARFPRRESGFLPRGWICCRSCGDRGDPAGRGLGRSRRLCVWHRGELVGGWFDDGRARASLRAGRGSPERHPTASASALIRSDALRLMNRSTGTRPVPSGNWPECARRRSRWEIFRSLRRRGLGKPRLRRRGRNHM